MCNNRTSWGATCCKKVSPQNPLQKFLHGLFLCCLLLGIACPSSQISPTPGQRQPRQQTSATPGQELVITTPEPVAPDQLSPEQRQELRRCLDTFYTDDKATWQAARAKVLAMGPLGIEVFCIFMLKFFGAGRDEMTLETGETVSKYWNTAQEELAALKEKAVPYVLVTMSHPKVGSTGRMLCSLTLAKIGKPAVPLLIANLTKRSHEFQRMALEALGNIGDPEAVAPIHQLYLSLPKPPAVRPDQPTVANNEVEDDASEDLRQYCMRTFGKIHSAAVIAGISDGLDDPSPAVREKAVEAVSRLRLPIQERRDDAAALVNKAIQVNQALQLKYAKALQRSLRALYERE